MEHSKLIQIENDDTYKKQDEYVFKKWQEMRIEREIDEKTEGRDRIYFLEGPPFISGGEKKEGKETSGLHTGHCLVSEIKSCLFNYYHMLNKKCDMYTGTDNHGLPIELFVSKILGIKTPDDIRRMGVEKFNEECKKTIIKYETMWDNVYKRIGRLIDTKYRYKTMDKEYMESVMWVFKILWEKDMIYKGVKILPYSYKTETGLSNFEASQAYKEMTVDTVYVSFKLKNKENTYMVAWTTTPWTLVSNMALCVNPTGEYVEIETIDNKKYIVGKNYVKKLGLEKKTIKITEIGMGKEMEGLEYEPIYEYYGEIKNRIIMDKFVDLHEDTGTGIVHISPLHGEVDYEVCIKNNIITSRNIYDMNDVDSKGNFNDKIKKYEGMNVFDTSKRIIEELEQKGMILRIEKYTHTYPHSDRTGEPLIYMVMPSYFVDVVKIKDNLIKNCDKVRWIPNYVGEKRFKNWLENVKDWCISRTRFFGTPIPIWTSEDGENICIGSIKELMEMANLTEELTDLHPEFLDKIIIEKNGKKYKRQQFVLDCWFESGCVPYGQIHYPFENEKIFDNREYLSDFVCEGIDQTRGWFYTLMVLSTALFDKPAYRNVVCTGLVLDDKGKKMSKRNGNYVDPIDIINEHGSDALRMYLLSSPATHAENLNFDQKNIKIYKQKLIQLQNGIKFIIEHVIAYNTKHQDEIRISNVEATNVFDRWIEERLNDVVKMIRNNFDEMEISQNVRIINDFIEDFTNWYLKLNRNRLKGKEGDIETKEALEISMRVIIKFIKVAVPYMPYLAEYVYEHIKMYDKEAKESILMCKYPEVYTRENDRIVMKMERMQRIIVSSRTLRMRKAEISSIRKPIKKIIISCDDVDMIEFINRYKETICEEVNCMGVEICTNANYIKYKIVPNMKNIALKYKKYMKDIKEILGRVPEEDMERMYKKETKIIVCNNGTMELCEEEVKIEKVMEVSDTQNVIAMVDGDMVISIECDMDDMMLEKYIVRQFCIGIQNERKRMGLHPWDKIEINYNCEGLMKEVLDKNNEECERKIQYDIKYKQEMDRMSKINIENLEGESIGVIWITIKIFEIDERT